MILVKKIKLTASFAKITQCKACSKKLVGIAATEKPNICRDCYEYYKQLKKYLDKYVDLFDIDDEFNKNVDGLISQYQHDRNFDNVFFSGYGDLIYQYFVDLPLSPPQSSTDSASMSSDEDSKSSDTDSGSKENTCTRHLKLQSEEYTKIKSENDAKIKNFENKNPHFRDFCKNHFPKGTSGESKTLLENSMILYLLELNNNGWKGGLPFGNYGNPLKLNQQELNEYTCLEYYAQQRREGKFRFVTLMDTKQNTIVKVYFTSTHYNAFLPINI